VSGDLAAVELAQMERGVRRRGLAEGVRVDDDVRVLAEQGRVQGARMQAHIALPGGHVNPVQSPSF
jgi:hypothetical protein